ncbi:MAG: amidohydrolase family protein [Anaerolineae bacterium]|jgi:imidazolonepropionase-like amidohydrolase
MPHKAIVNATLVDGTGSPSLPSGAVLIQDERVAAVGSTDSLPIPPGTEVIDGTGLTVLPGIIDTHMHVTSMPGLLDAHGHLVQSFRGIGKLRQCLGWGTTTVANVGGCPENVLLRRAIEEGHVRGVARLVVGAMVNATGGHVRGRSADGPWEVRKAVREMLMHGADFIKTAASGGFMWEHERISWEDYTEEELHALVSEAHARDKRVAVHAHAQPGLNHSIAAGCDIITHGALIDDEALEGIAAKGLFFVPTLFITSQDSYERPHLPPFMKARMQEAHPVHREGVRKARRMGITIAAGTDGGPGDAMKEMVELVRCGLSPLEAIVAGTRNSAHALDVLGRVGTLEPGKLADLILVRGNPLGDIEALTDRANLALVMKEGRVEVTDEEYREHWHPAEWLG